MFWITHSVSNFNGAVVEIWKWLSNYIPHFIMNVITSMLGGARRSNHDDVIKWKHFPRYWPFVRGIHRSPMNSPHKGQWRGAMMCLWSAPWINGWVNNRETGDLRRNRAHYDVTVMICFFSTISRHWDGAGKFRTFLEKTMNHDEIRTICWRLCIRLCSVFE